MLILRGIDHVVLRVTDMGVMVRFYCDILGARHVAYRAELRMSHLRVGDSMIDLVEAREPGTDARNMDHLCLRVAELDPQRVVDYLKKNGVKVGEVRDRFGAEGNGVSIYLTDPEGNTVELKGPSDGAAQPPTPR